MGEVSRKFAQPHTDCLLK